MQFLEYDELDVPLQQLETWKQIAFMATVGERMFMNYLRFFDETGVGDPSVLRYAFDLAWDWMESGTVPKNIDSVEAACEQQAPDTASFRSPYTSAALDAANVAVEILEAIAHPEQAKPLEVTSLARDSIDLFVQEYENLDPNSVHFEEKILRNALMQKELRRQRDVLSELRTWKGTRMQLVGRLRDHYSKPSQGSLDV